MANSNEVKKNADGSVDASNLPESFGKTPEHRLLKNRDKTLSKYKEQINSNQINEEVPEDYDPRSFVPKATTIKSLGEIKPEIVVEPRGELTESQISIESWMEEKGVLAWAISASKVLPEKTWKKIFKLYLNVLEKQSQFNAKEEKVLKDLSEGNLDEFLDGIRSYFANKGKKSGMELSTDHIRSSVDSSDWLDKICEMTDDEIREQMITLEQSIEIKSKQDPNFLPPRCVEDYVVLDEEDIMAESEEDEMWTGFFNELYKVSSEYSNPFKTLVSSLEEDSSSLKEKFNIIQELVYMEGDEKIQSQYNNIFKKISDLSEEINIFNKSLARDLVENNEDIK